MVFFSDKKEVDGYVEIDTAPKYSPMELDMNKKCTNE